MRKTALILSAALPLLGAAPAHREQAPRGQTIRFPGHTIALPPFLELKQGKQDPADPEFSAQVDSCKRIELFVHAPDYERDNSADSVPVGLKLRLPGYKARFYGFEAGDGGVNAFLAGKRELIEVTFSCYEEAEAPEIYAVLRSLKAAK